MNLLESAGGLSFSSVYLKMFKAEVLDRDLRDPLSDADVADLKKHLYTNLVLVFHDQRLTNTEFVTFARQFGETNPSEFRRQNVSAYRHDFPDILVLDKDYDPSGGTRHQLKRTEGWPSDPRLPGQRDEIGMLLADDATGDVAPTQWLDLRAAFASMSAQQQEYLKKLVGIHRNTHSNVDEIHEFHRPLVAPHPVTGAPSLDIHENSLWDIAGVDHADGRKIIDGLFKQVAVPVNIYTHMWNKSDVVIWDNLSLVHRRVGPITSGRRLHRIYAHELESSEATTTLPRCDLVNCRGT